jgi:hypothetical protein
VDGWRRDDVTAFAAAVEAGMTADGCAALYRRAGVSEEQVTPASGVRRDGRRDIAVLRFEGE